LKGVILIMNVNDYINESARTMAPNIYHESVNVETLHGIIGISGEAGELIDAAKKALFYGHDLDKKNIKEELGDILWYIAAVIRSEGWTFEEIMEENIDKLKKRYPEQFTSELAKERLDKKG